MGGGDLNLKKSWHPSTLRNIERVWKAEQKHDAEQRKIEQLQKELQDERNKEEIRQYAEDHGVVKKKNERLDWMYQGPAALVDREQYLVGRSVDRTFEVLDQLQNNKLPEDESNQAGALFCQSNINVTVDLANKIREDPLFTIRKKETEQKKNLLNNPVKMKQLRELLEMAVSKKDKKKHKKSKKHNTKISEERESRTANNHRSSRNKDRRSSKKDCSSSEENIRARRRRHQRSSSSSSDENTEQRKRSNSDEARYQSEKRTELNRGQEKFGRDAKLLYRSKPYGLIVNKSAHYGDNQPERKRVRHSRSRSPATQPKAAKVVRAPSPPRRKLTEEEMEEKRRLMMADAKWRDEQREQNVRKYRKEDEKEEKHKGKPVDFIRPMLSAATDSGSVESRIRQKMFSLQRSSSTMNENFTRK